MSSIPVDYVLDNRHMPGAQRVRVPEASDFDYDDEVELASSLRANFMPAGMPLMPADDPVLKNYAMSYPSSLVSPMFSHLPSVKPEMLKEASEKAQTLRRKLLRGANVLIIQGGYSGKMFIYEKLKELGVSVTIMDGPDTVWRQAAEDGVIAGFCEIDFTDNATVLERAMETILGLEQKFDAVTTYFEDAVALAARIATALGLESNSVKACDQARNKRITRQVMRECGLPVPKFYKIDTADELDAACEEVGFPAILKPVFGAASMGVTKVLDADATKAAYKKIFATLDKETDAVWAQGTEMVLEEYYDGDEFDIDILLFEGEAVYAKISDNWACWEPWFQEVGTNCPSLYPESKQKELIQLAIDSTLVLGFKYGAFHVELKYTSRGPRLIEVNARMGGVSVYDCNKIAWGVDLVEEHMMAVLKIPIRPVIPEKPLAYFAETAINAPYSGVVTSETWLDGLLKDSRVKIVHYMAKKGSKVIGPEDGVPSWIGEIRVVDKESGDAACELIRGYMRDIADVPIAAAVPGTERGWYFPDSMHPFVKVLE
uniref:ATP-grasp domain-containing protein n=1 Tax=Timspurckia oligopyrenoides TaxID=708627 RepID=A0A7S0ZJC2_9RHOD|mmetsp:Transcript_7417/g.13384  ORF Transcript_7417/g.13384 Transcript_7417/m.13384 type:complete len:545 (+) Transcript_7417:69-1703(+)